MKPLLSLAARSAWNRRFALSLVVVSIALSSFLLMGIERIRQDVRDNFSQAVSGTDLIVGARTGPVQLLLYSVFRIGNATNNIRWSSAQALAQHRAVAWTVPLSLGDSHRGFAVLGTTGDYFRHFRHGDKQPLRFAHGKPFEGLYDVVLGADVAARLGYRLGQPVVLAHGDGALQANDHADKPFSVVGILAPTGTPVDRTLHVSLQAIEALHVDWIAGARLPGVAVSAEAAAQRDLTPRSITALLLGLKNRAAVFSLQREVAGFRDEPLLAILPGVALDELWEVVALGERGLQAMSALVALVSVGGLVAVILAGLNERRRELAILRAVGAGPRQVLWLLALEGALVTLAGVALGVAACWLAVAGAGGWVQGHFGLTLQAAPPGATEWRLIGALLAGGWLASLLPGWRAYRLSLADGLSPRL
ncbi:ABC transporter permease [Aquincola sp. S2]|uniref:ABC transporter permease n=1 Tax=Pseudaquabacterium terrae TaxID=2732868 RepID=A0ABX2EL69_9BURK|nr:ABC transporter permease [Aquabacterium terrae]NRF69344.1 ABC transporter permease [Aquabacterium terrae]